MSEDAPPCLVGCQDADDPSAASCCHVSAAPWPMWARLQRAVGHGQLMGKCYTVNKYTREVSLVEAFGCSDSAGGQTAIRRQ